MCEASCLGYGACEHHERSKTPGPRDHREGDRLSRVELSSAPDRTRNRMTRSRSGIPWAERWPASTNHESYEAVAIRQLPVVIGGGSRMTAGQSFFGFAARYHSIARNRPAYVTGWGRLSLRFKTAQRSVTRLARVGRNPWPTCCRRAAVPYHGRSLTIVFIWMRWSAEAQHAERPPKRLTIGRQAVAGRRVLPTLLGTGAIADAPQWGPDRPLHPKRPLGS